MRFWVSIAYIFSNIDEILSMSSQEILHGKQKCNYFTLFWKKRKENKLKFIEMKQSWTAVHSILFLCTEFIRCYVYIGWPRDNSTFYWQAICNNIYNEKMIDFDEEIHYCIQMKSIVENTQEIMSSIHYNRGNIPLLLSVYKLYCKIDSNMSAPFV